jgi:hypothetical protein
MVEVLLFTPVFIYINPFKPKKPIGLFGLLWVICQDKPDFYTMNNHFFVK